MEYLICAQKPDARLMELMKLIRAGGKKARILKTPRRAQTGGPACAVFPFRIAHDTLNAYLSALCPGSICFGGKLPEGCKEILARQNLTWIDLLNHPRYVKENAALTAEGALCALMRKTRKAVCDSRVALTGFGNVSKACAKVFSALGAKIVILARDKGARKRARKLGFTAIGLPPKKKEYGALKNCDALMNTVCAPGILTGALAAALSSNAPVFDLASGEENASGAFLDLCDTRYQRLPALPARACPQSAARILFSAIRTTKKRIKKGRMPSV